METIMTIIGSPIPNILVLAGVAFLLLSVIGNIGAKIVVTPQKQKYAGILGTLLLIVGLGIHIIPDNKKPNGIMRNPVQPEASDCKQLYDEIRNREEDLHINRRERERTIEEMNRLEKLLETDPDLHEAYRNQENGLRRIDEHRRELEQQIEEFRKKKDETCA